MATTYRSFDDLPPKWQVFAREYLVDRMVATAARRAGVSQTLGRRVLAHKVGRAWIDERTQTAADRCDITQDYILMEMKVLKEDAHKDQDYGSALRALEGMGKHLKMFTDKIEASGDVTINVNTGVPKREVDDNDS